MMDAHQQAVAASEPVAVLEPIYNELEDDGEYDEDDIREVLRLGVEKRQSLYLTRDMYLRLGRSQITGIADPLLSRQLCRIRKNPRSFWFEILKPNHNVYVNGQPVTEKQIKLYDRFVISLLHHKYAYRFKVLIKESRQQELASAAPAATAQTLGTSSSATPKNSSSISEEVECAVCLDVMVKTTLLPCGHCFCQECVVGRTDCPTCRQESGDTRISCKRFDDVIHKLMLEGRHFEREDTDVYFERTGLPPPSVTKKRSGGGDDGVDHDSKRQRLVVQTTEVAAPPQPQITLLTTPKPPNIVGGSRDTAICLE